MLIIDDLTGTVCGDVILTRRKASTEPSGLMIPDSYYGGPGTYHHVFLNLEKITSIKVIKAYHGRCHGYPNYGVHHNRMLIIDGGCEGEFRVCGKKRKYSNIIFETAFFTSK